MGEPQIDLRFASNIDPEIGAGAARSRSARDAFAGRVEVLSPRRRRWANFAAARAWLEAGISKEAASKHLIARRQKPDVAKKAGIAEPNLRVLGLGGRTLSVWSNCSLSVEIALAVKPSTPSCKAPPIWMAHVLSAARNRTWFPGGAGRFLERLDSGLPIARDHLTRRPAFAAVLPSAIGDGERRQVRAGGMGGGVSVPTSPAIFGGEGATSQHSFFQWLHQGTSVCRSISSSPRKTAWAKPTRSVR